MQRLRKFINQKILPQIRKRRINSYQVFCQFKRVLMPKKAISNQFYLNNNYLEFNDQDSIKFITLLLKKRPQQRSQLQKQSIYKTFIKTKYFQQLQKQTESEVIKLLIKNSRIIRVNKKSVLFDEGDQIKSIYVLLKGKIGILANSYKQQMNQKFQTNLLRTLIKNLLFNQPKSPLKKKKKSMIKGQSNPSSFICVDQPIFQFHKLELEELNISDYVEQGRSFGDENLSVYGGHKVSAVVMEDSYLLELNLILFLKLLKIFNEKKLKKQIELFRKFKCFDMLQDDQLAKLIKTTVIQQKPKNQYIFKQGDQSNYFYILIEGEISINKLAKLFIENPNKLYANRLSWQQQKRNIKTIPFANFQNLYNYRPKEQNVELGIIGKDNIFGEQQTFMREIRQTNAKVISTNSKYYIIDLIQLENILKEKKYQLQDFKDFLFGTTTKKKILYRQDKLSEVLTLKNKKNLDYFYLQDQTQKQTPKKFQIQKINNKFSQTQRTTKKETQLDQSEKPYFTQFNFNQFLNTNQSQAQNIQQQTTAQKQMMELTHTNKFIQKQINFHDVLRKVKNFKKGQINLSNPLFQANYFSSLNKDIKRLDHEYRKKKFTIKPPSSLRKSRNKSGNK